jgi:hypothetical protein
MEDLEPFHEKIKKDVRLVQQEEQIAKGKAIILHNKLTEVKQEKTSQLQRK